ncbi:hypothetical protein BDV98DRAFT_493219, partial [Pterulicium gracile]
LNSTNYNDWVDPMQACLVTKGYWWIVSGEEPHPSPPDGAEARAWDRSNAKGGALIFLKLDDQRKAEFKGRMMTGDILWRELRVKFVHQDSHRRFAVYEDLLNVRKEPGEDMDTLTGRISAILTRVKTSRPAAFTLDDLDTDLHCMALLNSLKDPEDSYGAFTSSLTILLDQLSVRDLEVA